MPCIKPLPESRAPAGVIHNSTEIRRRMIKAVVRRLLHYLTGNYRVEWRVGIWSCHEAFTESKKELCDENAKPVYHVKG